MGVTSFPSKQKDFCLTDIKSCFSKFLSCFANFLSSSLSSEQTNLRWGNLVLLKNRTCIPIPVCCLCFNPSTHLFTTRSRPKLNKHMFWTQRPMQSRPKSTFEHRVCGARKFHRKGGLRTIRDKERSFSGSRGYYQQPQLAGWAVGSAGLSRSTEFKVGMGMALLLLIAFLPTVWKTWSTFKFSLADVSK